MTFENKYDAKEREVQIRKFWDENDIFKFDENSSKVVFSIDTPPPTISGKMHIGHAFSFSQADFIARYKRMRGFEVFYPFGTDDNGLATEKLVQKEKKVNLRKVDRAEAIKIVVDYLNEERPKFIEDFKNVGLSCDFDLAYSTINDHSRKISQNTFLELVEKGLITRTEGPVMWDRVFQTPIAQAELEDDERESLMNYVKAKVVGTTNTFMIYATTRPELLFACAGFSVEDEGEYVKLKVGEEFWITSKATYEEKFADFEYEVVEKLKGKNVIGDKVIIPVTNKEIEVTHDAAVKADFGTGIAYFCSYGGAEDIEYFARHRLDPIEVLSKDGRLNSKCLKYEGELTNDARRLIIKDMTEEGSIIKSEKIRQVVNLGERSGVEVEFIVTKQWYVNYLDKKEYFFEMAQKFNWHPEFMKHRLENWIKGLNWNWGFSRQRHFGIPVPAWYCSKCGETKYAKELQLPVDPTSTKPLDKCSCGSEEFEGETDIMDTWFTSGSSPFLAIELVKNEEMKKKLFPMDLRPQAHDIINFWLFYTMAKTNLLYDENPFKNVMVSGFVLDPKGKKMSKSKGNTIVPQDVVSKHSNDGLRFAAASTKLGSDIPFQEKEVQTGVKVANKLYNANKFASMLFENFEAKDRDFKFKDLNSIDKWIIAKVQSVIKDSIVAFDNYDYAKVKSLFADYFMRDIADNYIEIVKQRLWKPENFGVVEVKKAQKALYYSLYSALRGLAPFLVYMSEEVYQNFYKQFEEIESVHRTSWPEYNKNFDDEEIVLLGDKYVDIVGAVRKFKSENQVSMKTELSRLVIECDDKLKEFIEDSIADLKAVTGARVVEFGNGSIESQDVKVLIEIVKD
ncbi:MAG: class I tRNA ligase family protein [Candidatus Woesearchaeota archaeon]|jgi:valyl-tRNA synthetase|nr:class I tRNA ligase family protein [Candidatus Woesearchaeota archaeon]